VGDITSGYKHLTTRRMRRGIRNSLSSAIPFKGRGDYVYTGPKLDATQSSIVGGSLIKNIPGGAPPPSVSNLGDGSIVLSGKEFVRNVYSPQGLGYQAREIILNPGNAALFPWANQVANNYSEYEFKKLVFRYTPTVNANASTTAIASGTVTLCTQYNPDEPAPVSKSDALSKLGAISVPASSFQSMYHAVECDPKKLSGPRSKYIRVPSDLDEDNGVRYDHGSVFICISDTPSSWAGIAIGELHVEYEMVLRKPKLAQSLGRINASDHFVIAGDDNRFQWGEGNPFGSPETYRELTSNTIGGFLTAEEGNSNFWQLKYHFPEHAYGYFEFRITVNAQTGFEGANPFNNGMGKGGNIDWVNDMVLSRDEGEPTHIYRGGAYNGTDLIPAGTQSVFVAVVHCLVRKGKIVAGNTGDNHINFTMNESVCQTQVLKWSIYVHKYQAAGDDPSYTEVSGTSS
jgi:hypothetical protein